MNRHRQKTGWIVLLAIGSVAAFLYFNAADADSLYEQANAIHSTDPLEADRLLHDAIAARDGNFPNAQVLRSILLLRRNEDLQALGCFSQIPSDSIDTVNPELSIELTRLAVKKRSHLLAELSAQSLATRPGPFQMETLETSLNAQLAQQQFEKALETAETLCQLQPSRTDVLVMKGSLCERLAKPLCAIDAYSRAIEGGHRETDDFKLRERLIELAIRIGDKQLARPHLESLKNKNTASFRLLDAKLLRLEGKFDQAARVLENLQADQTARLHEIEFLKGLVAFDQQDYQAASKHLQQVVSQEPMNKEAHYKLGRAFQMLDKPDEAARHLRKSKELTDAVLKQVESL